MEVRGHIIIFTLRHKKLKVLVCLTLTSFIGAGTGHVNDMEMFGLRGAVMVACAVIS